MYKLINVGVFFPVLGSLKFQTVADEEDSLVSPVSVVLIFVGSFLLILFVVFLAIAIRRFQNRKRTQSIAEQEQNPVYGLYYFPDGNVIDSGNSLAQDNNSYYGL